MRGTKGGPGPKERYESVVLECVLGPLGLVQHTSGQTFRGTQEMKIFGKSKIQRDIFVHTTT